MTRTIRLTAPDETTEERQVAAAYKWAIAHHRAGEGWRFLLVAGGEKAARRALASAGLGPSAIVIPVETVEARA